MVKYAETTIDEVARISILDYIQNVVDLEEKGKDYFGLCPFHNENTPSFSVTPETNNFYCFGCGTGGNIINFVMQYHNYSFAQAIKHLLQYANIDTRELKKESETFNLFKKMSRLTESRLKTKEHDILPVNIMDSYSLSGLEPWKKEGMSDAVLEKYQVRMDRNACRIVYPIHDEQGNIINIKGRIMSSNWKDRQLRKYTYYYPLDQSDFLFGLYHNKYAIEEKRSVIVFESAKSVMIMESNGVKNVVSIETSHFSDEQIMLLLSLKCDIIIALDNDISLENIKKGIKSLIKMTNVYVVKDTFGILEKKDSPCDKGFDVWKKLYESRIRL